MNTPHNTIVRRDIQVFSATSRFALDHGVDIDPPNLSAVFQIEAGDGSVVRAYYPSWPGGGVVEAIHCSLNPGRESQHAMGRSGQGVKRDYLARMAAYGDVCSPGKGSI